MYYEINVALKGKHLFATSNRSCTDRVALETVYSELAARFPKSEGFELSVTHYKTRGVFITMPGVK